MTGWTKQGIEAMGYEEYPDSDVLEMSFFGLVRVYSLQGILFEDSCPDKKTEVIALSDYCSVAIAQSVNEALNMLVACDDLLCDDEEKWLTEKKKEIPLISEFPFLLIYFKITKPAKLKGGYRKEEDGCIHTFEAFPEISEEIARWKDKELPSIVISLTVNFSTLNQSIKLVPAHCIFFGITKEGRVLYDLTSTVTVDALAAYRKNTREINGSLSNSKRLLPLLTKDEKVKEVCRNFYVALNEPDKRNQFLFYFYFIETYTNITFFGDRKVSIAEKFIWCKNNVWNHIDKSDLSNFRKIKEVRDKISHGKHVERAKLPIDKTRALAVKLLSANKK